MRATFGALLIFFCVSCCLFAQAGTDWSTAAGSSCTTVTPRDVARILERVATLDGFINANINAQVQGYIVSRDIRKQSGQKRRSAFQIGPTPL